MAIKKNWKNAFYSFSLVKIRSVSDVSLSFVSSVARWFFLLIRGEYGSVMELCKVLKVKGV